MTPTTLVGIKARCYHWWRHYWWVVGFLVWSDQFLAAVKKWYWLIRKGKYIYIRIACVLHTCWHISLMTKFFSWLGIFFFLLSLTKLLSDLAIWVTRRVSYRKQELLAFHEHLSSPLLCPCYSPIKLSGLFFVAVSSSCIFVSDVTSIFGLCIRDCTPSFSLTFVYN